MDPIEADMARVKGEIDKLLKDYEGTITKAEDRETFSKITPAREKFISIRDQALLPLSRLLKTEEAIVAFKNQLSPAYQEFLAACQARGELQ